MGRTAEHRARRDDTGSSRGQHDRAREVSGVEGARSPQIDARSVAGGGPRVSQRNVCQRQAVSRARLCWTPATLSPSPGILQLRGDGASPAVSSPRCLEVPTAVRQVFDNEWRTRLVWSSEELSIVEAEREKAMQIAAMRLKAPPASERQEPPEAAVAAQARGLPAAALPAPTAGPGPGRHRDTGCGPGRGPTSRHAARGAASRATPPGRAAGPIVLPSAVLHAASAIRSADIESPPVGLQTQGPSAGVVRPCSSGGAGERGRINGRRCRCTSSRRAYSERGPCWSRCQPHARVWRTPYRAHGHCAIQLTSPEISRSHARLRVTPQVVRSKISVAATARS